MEDLITKLVDSAISLGILAVAWRFAEMRYAYERERVKQYAEWLRNDHERTRSQLALMHAEIRNDIPVERRRQIIEDYTALMSMAQSTKNAENLTEISE